MVPDSPAAKAGLVQYDVILKADDKKITEVSDLLQAVEAAKDKEMKLEIIHDGQPKTIAVTPAKRPEDARLPAPPPESDIEAFRKWIEQFPTGERVRPAGSDAISVFQAGSDSAPRRARYTRRFPGTCRFPSPRPATSRPIS